MDLINICRVFHPTTKQYIIFSAAHGMLAKIDHILGHKANLNKFLKIEITTCIISNHDGIKLEFNKKRSYRKYSKHGD
jgi:hypothetical protein